MRTKLGWVLAAMAYVAGVLLIVHQHSWWYPNQNDLVVVATPTSVGPSTPPLAAPTSLSFLSPEVKDLFALYQRSTYHLPHPLQDFLLERLRSWSDLSPDMRADTAAILQQLTCMDRHQALVYVQRLWIEFSHSKVQTSEHTVRVE